MDDNTLLFLGLGVAMVLLLLVLLIWTYKLSSRISRLQQELDRLHGDEQEAEKYFNQLADKLDRRLIVAENTLRKLLAAESQPAAQAESKQAGGVLPGAAAVKPAPQASRESYWEAFLRQYNLLGGVRSGYDRKQARDTLKQQYNFLTFSCVNFDERMRVPGVAPVFADSAAGDFWAVKTDRGDTFLVVPNALMTYESQKHNTGGMREVFQSNYREGAYNQIEVVRPAFFQRTASGWLCRQPGLIRLK